MNTTDPIADMLTRIRNASAARHKDLTVPSSKVKREIARVLTEEGFIESWTTEPGEVQESLSMRLKYVEGRTPVVSGLKRISKPGLRVYVGKERIPRVYGGVGIAVLSTPRGVVTGERAKRENVGGELLAYVW